MKKVMLLAGFCSLLAACQSEKEPEYTTPSDSMPMYLEASIASDRVTSRTTVTEEGNSSFMETDRIGFFHPDAVEACCWEYDGANWNTASDLNWENKVESFHFCAFYPYQEGAVRTAVPMPDLSVQTGELDHVGNLDFLAGHCDASYSDGGGIVSFTGADAFQHVYAMLKIVVNKNEADDNMTVHTVKYEGEDIVTPHTYCFGDNFTADELVKDPSPVSTLTLTPEASVDEGGYTIVVLLNPVTLSTSLNLTFEYTRNGISYTASTDKLGTEFTGGKLYEYTLRLKKEDIIIEGNAISNWDSMVGEDIWVDENHTSD